MWFDEIAAADNPELKELRGFVRGTVAFLELSLKEEAFFVVLWKKNKQLRQMASQTFEKEVLENVKHLNATIEQAHSDDQSYGDFKNALTEHGLIGQAMRFKLAVLNYIANKWDDLKNDLRRQVRIRAWLKQMFDAIDAVLDSLIEATGAGHLLKEFKDTLSALATAA
jgi:hypothetical protein